MVFSYSYVWCESWIIKKAEHQGIDTFELWFWRSLLDYKEIKPVHPKGYQLWISIWKSDGEAPNLWPCDVNNWLIRKPPDAGKVWRQEEKGMTEDETVGWHHWLNGHEFEQAPGDGERPGNVLQSTGLQRVRRDYATEQQHRKSHNSEFFCDILKTMGKVEKIMPF